MFQSLPTLRIFDEGHLSEITRGLLGKVAPKAVGHKSTRQAEILDALAPVMTGLLARYAIDSDLRIAHFLAQACHETDGFCTTVEYWGPSRAQLGYEGRANLGNILPGDGKRFMGRGIFQLTGRSNYARMGAKLGFDLVGNPQLAANPVTSLVIACEYWKERRINPLADADDIDRVTRKINGGLNGIEDRRACLSRAKMALAHAGIAAASKPKSRLAPG